MRLLVPLVPDARAPLARANPVAKLGAALILLVALFASLDGVTALIVLAALMASGILILSFAQSAPLGLAAAALIGFGLGGEADITPYLLTRYFGLRSFSTLYGLTWTAYAIAGAIGPVIMGRAFDLSGSYTALLTLLAGATFVSSLLFLLMPRYPRAE